MESIERWLADQVVVVKIKRQGDLFGDISALARDDDEFMTGQVAAVDGAERIC
ncbi:MAG TPA: hypothetical protein VNE42_00600 [Acidimicrobiales bacterium]|nr:hypothetical protein [Acidimicrobiales bacterium]